VTTSSRCGSTGSHGVLVPPRIHRRACRLDERVRWIPVGKPLGKVDRVVLRRDPRHLADQRLGEDGGAA
jgi:hypothetical protein